MKLGIAKISDRIGEMKGLNEPGKWKGSLNLVFNDEQMFLSLFGISGFSVLEINKKSKYEGSSNQR